MERIKITYANEEVKRQWLAGRAERIQSETRHSAITACETPERKVIKEIKSLVNNI
jgi:hypothetical protein